MTYGNLNEMINDLSNMFNDAVDGETGWGEVWNLVREIGSSFKLVRYPSRGQHQEAWERFQKIVGEIKRHKEEAEERSAELKATILDHLSNTNTSRSNAFQVMFDAFFDGMCGITEEQDLDNWKEELQDASSELHAARDVYYGNKEELLSADRKEVGQELYRVKERLDNEWSAYKDSRRDLRRERLNEKIVRTEEHLEGLYEAQTRREEILERLYEQQDDAEGDRLERIEGWIEEEEARLSDIQEGISNTEDRLTGYKSQLEDI